MSTVSVVILAAGEGSRMKSSLPKVLHPLAGRPVVGHVVDAVRAAGVENIALVVPQNHDAMRAVFGDDVAYAVQDPPRGTGDAAACGLRALEPADGLVLVLNGDGPCLRPDTIRRMIETQGNADGVFLAVEREDPTGYGRMVRDSDGSLDRIVEEADCDEEQRAVTQVNSGGYLFRAEAMREALAALTPDNAQGEYYLTDTLAVIRSQGGRVELYVHDDAEEVQGINTRAELGRCEEVLRARKIDELMAAGVTVRMPHTVLIDTDVEVGADTTLYPGVTLEAGTRIGAGCTVYPNVRVARSTIGDDVTVLDGTIVEDSTVEAGASLGPYARLRPGASVGPGAKVGNFVEMKNTRLGAGAKASHLTYLGDADVGAGANIGAGTITCNYDGKNKHKTTIGEGAFIGSNTALVAPVRIGDGAYVGAGSTITKDLPDESLGVARGRQIVKTGWAERKNTNKD
ncbi:MAG: UDP-N-acetylglucosamine diphosphorylase/glucosamine-1-phosphate N-acetyltransferase [Acidobacteria bacterium]|nr:UDP-N-acetylglucosamine diphosphorylase/glucosamine-1-phosphate N-acetyltransferase [Acidobacteriota bacterium]